MWELLFVTEMPSPVVPVTVKPWTTIQLLFEMVNPWSAPLTVTVSLGAVVKVMGAVEVPEFATVTTTVWPAIAVDAPFPIVQKGCVAEPGPEFEQLGFAPST
jgi:hypothetical protein